MLKHAILSLCEAFTGSLNFRLSTWKSQATHLRFKKKSEIQILFDMNHMVKVVYPRIELQERKKSFGKKLPVEKGLLIFF